MLQHDGGTCSLHFFACILNPEMVLGRSIDAFADSASSLLINHGQGSSLVGRAFAAAPFLKVHVTLSLMAGCINL